MDPGEQTTGTRDEHYNLISVLYHALHGAETCETYATDAEMAGKEDLATFFREAQDEQMRLAEQAKELLGIEITTPAGAGGATVASEVTASGATAGTDLTPDAPTEEIPGTANVPRTTPRGTPGDLERGTSPEPAPPGGEAPGSVRTPGDVQREESTPPAAPPEPPPRATPP